MSAVFTDVAEVLRHGLVELGYAASVSPAALAAGCPNIILGAHLVEDTAQLPDDSIILNLEQLGSSSVQLTPAYLDCLRRHAVWDYSPRNIAWLARHGVHARLLRLGYAPALERVGASGNGAPVVQDIDVLFYGALNARRNLILQRLQQAGLRVEVVAGGALGEQLDALIARSKVVLNLYYYDTKIFEIVRVSYLLNNSKAVVAEVSEDTEIEAALLPALLGVPYDDLAEACRLLVADDARRQQLEATAYALFSARSQAQFIQQDILDAAVGAVPRKINLSSGKDFKPLALPEIILRRSTPVIINSFNQLTYVRDIVTRLRGEGFCNIYVLDQASTYPPLRQWLDGTHERGEALPLFSNQNKGPHDFFVSRMYDMFGGAPFIYSDPDLAWERLAPNFLSRLFELAHRYRVFKVGPALTIPTPEQAKPGLTVMDLGVPRGVAEFEARFWQNEVEPGVYNSPIDTTMHLFIPYYYQQGTPLITGLRVSGPGFDLTHLPWFASDPMPADEHAFYMGLTTHTTWRMGHQAGDPI
jgi:hypothetical protein